MVMTGSPSEAPARREACGLDPADVACLDGDGRVLSRQHVLGDRGMTLDGSRSGNPLNEDLGRDGTGSHHADDGGGRRRALVADEDPMMLWLLKRALDNDFDVTVVQDGQ